MLKFITAVQWEDALFPLGAAAALVEHGAHHHADTAANRPVRRANVRGSDAVGAQRQGVLDMLKIG